MTEPPTNPILAELLKEIEPHAKDIGLYALTVGQVLGLCVLAEERAQKSGNQAYSNTSKWLMKLLIENHPEIMSIIQKYERLLQKPEKIQE